MTLSILAVANGGSDDAVAIAAAADLARRHEGRAVVVDTYAIQPMMYAAAAGGGYRPAPVMEGILEEEAHVRRQIREMVEAEAARIGVSADVLSFAPEGRGLDALAPELPLADFVVMAQSMADGSGPWTGPLGEALFEARTPVYLARKGPSAAGGKAVIAWDGGLQAARAVRAALPLLREALEVAILQDQDEIDADSGGPADAGRLASYLADRGVRVAAEPLQAKGRNVGRVLVESAHTYGAALLVAGAYSHARIREALLGGVTRSFLEDRQGPHLFLSH